MKPKLILVAFVAVFGLFILASIGFAASPTSNLLEMTNEILNRILGQITNNNAILQNHLETTNSLLANQLQVQQISTGTFIIKNCEVNTVKLTLTTGVLVAASDTVEDYAKACRIARGSLESTCKETCGAFKKTTSDVACIGFISDVSIDKYSPGVQFQEENGSMGCTASAKCTCDP